MHKISNVSERNMSDLEQILEDFLPYAKKYMAYNKPVSIQMLSDPENAKDPLGKTAYYSPDEMKVTVFVDGRHLKDILRSISHELVHHTQNCRGDLNPPGGCDTKPGYAQRNKHMRNMEREAYEKGNLCLRDWEDQFKLTESVRKAYLFENKTPFFTKEQDKMSENTRKVVPEGHACAHHVKENMSGRKGFVVNHNWNSDLKEITKYDVDFGDVIVEGIPVEKLQILEYVEESHHMEEGHGPVEEEKEEKKAASQEKPEKKKDKHGSERKEHPMRSGKSVHEALLEDPVLEELKKLDELTASGEETEIKENKYDWTLKEKDDALFESLVKKWCK